MDLDREVRALRDQLAISEGLQQVHRAYTRRLRRRAKLAATIAAAPDDAAAAEACRAYLAELEAAPPPIELELEHQVDQQKAPS